MAKVKVRLLTSLSGKDINVLPGETIEVSEQVAISYVSGGIAECVAEKDVKRLKLIVENDLKARAEEEAQIKAIKDKKVLQDELYGLYVAVVRLEFAMEGVVPDDDEVTQAIENIINRDAKKGK